MDEDGRDDTDADLQRSRDARTRVETSLFDHDGEPAGEESAMGLYEA